MTMKPTGVEVAKLAEFVADGERVPYVFGKETLTAADCQGFVEAVVRKLGGSMSYRGSNDMMRNACNFFIPIADAKRQGMKPGGGLFIVKQDGKEPSHYKDSLGNASHVGLYTGLKYFSVHSSSAANDVVGTDEKYPWTHYGEFKAIDYGLAVPFEPAPTYAIKEGILESIAHFEQIIIDLKYYADLL